MLKESASKSSRQKKIFLFSFKRCTSKAEVMKVKIIYLVIFFALPIIFQIAKRYSFQPIEKIEDILPPIVWVCMTIWAAYKLHMSIGRAIFLAIIAIFPFGVVVPLIVILIQKPAIETITQDKIKQ